jgi:hypothetical protein
MIADIMTCSPTCGLPLGCDYNAPTGTWVFGIKLPEKTRDAEV